MAGLVFAWRGLRREWRGRDLRLLGIALAVAVAAVSAVNFFTERVALAVARQAGELLAADLVVESSRPLAAKWQEAAQRFGLATAQTLAFRSMALAGERMQLAEIKAVGPGYPLRGALKVAARPYTAGSPTAALPAPGTAWLDSRLAQLLDLAPGGRVRVGERNLTVTHILAYEPDRGGELFNIAPRLLMNLEDVPATGLVQLGSLLTYRLLLAGPAPGLQRFEAWAREAATAAADERIRLLGVREARPELRAALDRAQRFLGLAALTSVLLAGVAAAMAARRYTLRHVDEVAVLRCLGATRGIILGSFLLRLTVLGLLASALGVAAGFAGQALLAALLEGLFAQTLPPPSGWPVLQGMLTGMVALVGFALPPVVRLRAVPPLRALRREGQGVALGGIALYATAGAALLILLAWQVRDLSLTLYAIVGAAAALLLFAALAWGALRLLLTQRRRMSGSWRFALSSLARRPRASVVQVVAFGIGLMALLLLATVRSDLLAEWRASLPREAPNRFLINIQAEQVAALEEFFEAGSAARPQFYPMVRGRLAAINGRPVAGGDYAEPRARRLVEREFNLSWTAELRPDNRVVAGRAWDGAVAGPQWSVEEGLARTLGLELGDRLRFTIGGQTVEGPITSLREVDWDSFRANFFVLAPPGVLEGFAASYITSFYLPEEGSELLRALLERFPNLTLIDVEALMERVRGIMDRVALAVEFVFGFTLLAGLLVLFAAIQATHDERLREGAILRTLGASRRQVMTGLAVEFGALGLLAGVLAAAASTAIGYLLATQVFVMSYGVSVTPWVWGAVGGLLTVGVAGLLGTRSILERPPLQVLSV